MAHLSIVKQLSHLDQEQRIAEQFSVDQSGLSLTRGAITEIAGGHSTGKTSFALSLLAQLTNAGEICAIVDASHRLDPYSAYFSGIELTNLLWVRCDKDIEKTFISTDHLVQAKGFGCIWLDLCGLPVNKLHYVPKTYWFRYRTRIKGTSTILIVTCNESVTGSATQHSFEFLQKKVHWSGSDKYKLIDFIDSAVTPKKYIFSTPKNLVIKAVYSEI